MVVVKKPNTSTDDKEEQSWENPKAPEQASDPRDLEQIERQKKEAEMRKDNLSDSDK